MKLYQPGHICAREEEPRNQRDVVGMTIHCDAASLDSSREQ